MKKNPHSGSHFKDLIQKLMQESKYALAKSEDIHDQPHVYSGDEAENMAQSHNELLLFELKTKLEVRIALFFFPLFRRVPNTLKLIAEIKRPNKDHLSAPSITCFDRAFFEHLEILKANGMVFNHELSTITDNQMIMGYVWNDARGMYEPVFEKK